MKDMAKPMSHLRNDYSYVISGYSGGGFRFLECDRQFNVFLGEGGETQSFISGFFGSLLILCPGYALMSPLLGIFLAYAMYSAKWISAEKIGRSVQTFISVFFNKYWLDTLYEKMIRQFSSFGRSIFQVPVV